MTISSDSTWNAIIVEIFCLSNLRYLVHISCGIQLLGKCLYLSSLPVYNKSISHLIQNLIIWQISLPRFIVTNIKSVSIISFVIHQLERYLSLIRCVKIFHLDLSLTTIKRYGHSVWIPIIREISFTLILHGFALK